jgi:hypothetical protein
MMQCVGHRGWKNDSMHESFPLSETELIRLLAIQSRFDKMVALWSNSLTNETRHLFSWRLLFYRIPFLGVFQGGGILCLIDRDHSGRPIRKLDLLGSCCYMFG